MSSQGFRLRPLPINRTYGRHNGETIFVLGCSMSMDEIDASVLVDQLKISVNRALRKAECRYLVFSDPDVFSSIRRDIARRYKNRWPQMLIWRNVLTNWRKYGLKLQDKKYYEMRLEMRDRERACMSDFPVEILEPDHPYAAYYKKLITDRRVLRKMKRGKKKAFFYPRAKYPGPMQLDGNFLRSSSTSTYAIEWAFRMVAGPKKSRIVLLGIDYCRKVLGLDPNRASKQDLTYMREIDTRTASDKKCRLVQADLVVPQLGRACRDLKQHNVELINCSPWSGPLDEFIPRRAISEVC